MLRDIWKELLRNDVTHPDSPMWYRRGNAFLAHAMFAVLVNTLVGPIGIATVPIQMVVYFLSKEINDILDGDWRVIPDSLMDTAAIGLGALLVQGDGVLAVIGIGLGWFSFPYRALRKPTA